MKYTSKMINNNLDYEKNSNNTANGGNITTTATITRRSHIAQVDTVTAATAAAAASVANDNSYFNRFDNRIAANLAAVINGARFRSFSSSPSSSSSSTSSPSSATSSKSSSTRTSPNANATNAKTAHHYQQQHHGVATLGRHSVRQSPPTTLSNTSSSSLSRGGGGSRPSSPHLSSASMGRTPRRPLHLFAQASYPNCNDNEKVSQASPPPLPQQTPSSDEDNSPTELNNCKRLADKPPLVKRLTMGLLRANEETRPLVSNITSTINSTTISTAATTMATNATLKLNDSTLHASNQIYSNGYVNEEAFEPEKYIASKFGDSCRQSLTAIPMLDTLNLNDNSEFNLKKRYLRETSSANSSPKIFANRLRMNATANAASRYNGCSGGSNTNNAFDDEEADLKDASWFQAGISRDIAVEVLSNKSPGAFLVRRSSSKPGCYALTLRVPSPPGPKIANYIILQTSRGYKIKGFRKEFASLKTLITHHSVMPELLPVPLAMPRPTNMTSSRRNLDDFDTYDSLQMLLKYLRAKNLENE